MFPPVFQKTRLLNVKGSSLSGDMVFSCFCRNKDSLLHLLLQVIRKAAERGQIMMAQTLLTSISETARLVDRSSSAAVSIYKMWVNDGKTSSRRQDF